MASSGEPSRSSRTLSRITYADYEFSDQEERQASLDSEGSASSDGELEPEFSRREAADQDDQDHGAAEDVTENDGEQSPPARGRRTTRSSQQQTSEPVEDSHELYEYDTLSTDKQKYELDKLLFKCEPSTKARKPTKRNPTPSVEAAASSKGKERSESKSTRSSSPKSKDLGEITFDDDQSLWYRKDPESDWERAVFHHWIRVAIAQEENAKGQYTFPRDHGSITHDTTCFHAGQASWGIPRANYAPIIFQYQRKDHEDPSNTVENLQWDGRLVIDYWLKPVRAFQEFPLVLSSKYEAMLMEAAKRTNSHIALHDFRARMPPFLDITGLKLYKDNAVSQRMRRFRCEAGCVSWYNRDTKLKAFMDKIQPNAPITNSTLEYNDLDALQLAQLYKENLGTKPEQARKSGGSERRQKANAQYVRQVNNAVKNAARSLGRSSEKSTSKQPEIGSQHYASREENAGESHDSQILSSPRRQVLEAPGLQTQPTLPAPLYQPQPIYLFYTGNPFAPVESLTVYQALLSPLVDRADTRNRFPESQDEHIALEAALNITIEDFQARMGYMPQLPSLGNYATIYQHISDQCQFHNGLFPYLTRRTKWTGSLQEWYTSGLEFGLGR